jgi:hypothetical protein
MARFPRLLHIVIALGVLLADFIIPVAAGADVSATVTVGQPIIDPGTSTQVTVEFVSAGSEDNELTVRVVPQTGAMGKVTLSDPQTATDPPVPDDGEWTCAVDAGDDQLIHCLWSGPGKQAGEAATVAVLATASSDATGPFQLSAVNAGLDGDVVLTSEQVSVANALPISVAPTAVPAPTVPATTIVRAITTVPPRPRVPAPRAVQAATPVPAPATTTVPPTTTTSEPTTTTMPTTTTVPVTASVVPASVTAPTATVSDPAVAGSDHSNRARDVLWLMVGIAFIAAGVVLMATNRRRRTVQPERGPRLEV